MHEQSPHSEANSSTIDKIPHILWNAKVHYDVQKSLPHVPVLCQINPAQAIPSYLRAILILFSHLCLSLPSSLLASGFPTKTL